MNMKPRTWWLAAPVTAIVAAVVAVILLSTGTSFAGLGDSSQPITGEALDKASAAALEHTGGGRVTGTETGDEDSYYEVEVTLDDGSQVDVQLDENFNVVSSAQDHEEAADDGADEGAGDANE